MQNTATKYSAAISALLAALTDLQARKPDEHVQLACTNTMQALQKAQQHVLKDDACVGDALSSAKEAMEGGTPDYEWTECFDEALGTLTMAANEQIGPEATAAYTALLKAEEAFAALLDAIEG